MHSAHSDIVQAHSKCNMRCTQNMHTVHAHRTCTQYMHTVYVSACSIADSRATVGNSLRTPALVNRKPSQVHQTFAAAFQAAHAVGAAYFKPQNLNKHVSALRVERERIRPKGRESVRAAIQSRPWPARSGSDPPAGCRLAQ